MNADQVRADLAQAEETGILVWTRDQLIDLFETARMRFPEANALFDQFFEEVHDRQAARAKPVAGNQPAN
jgi:hypothetical protein